MPIIAAGDLDIAEHLLESLDAARRQRWKETTENLYFFHTSRKSWTLICRLGASERPPTQSHPPVRANAVTAHLINITKHHETNILNDGVHDQWLQFK